MKEYLVSVIYLNDIASSFVTKTFASSHIAAIGDVLAYHRNSKSKSVSIYSLYFNDNAYCSKDLRVFVTEL